MTTDDVSGMSATMNLLYKKIGEALVKIEEIPSGERSQKDLEAILILRQCQQKAKNVLRIRDED